MKNSIKIEIRNSWRVGGEWGSLWGARLQSLKPILFKLGLSRLLTSHIWAFLLFVSQLADISGRICTPDRVVSMKVKAKKTKLNKAGIVLRGQEPLWGMVNPGDRECTLCPLSTRDNIVIVLSWWGCQKSHEGHGQGEGHKPMKLGGDGQKKGL